MSFESAPKKPKNEFEDKRPKADENVAIALPDLSHQSADSAEKTPDLGVKNFTLGDSSPEVYENGVLRSATPEEQKEIALQQGGAEPSKGMPRFQFGEPEKVVAAGSDVKEKSADTDQSSVTSDGIKVNDLNEKLDKRNAQKIDATGPKIKQTEEYYDAAAALDRARDNQSGGRGGGRGAGGGGKAPRNSGSGPIFEGAKDGGIREWAVNKRDYVDIEIKTMPQIANDPVAQARFGRLISAMDPVNAPNVLAKMKTATPLTREEAQMVYYAQHEYSRRFSEWEKHKDQITVSDLKNSAARSPELAHIVTLIGENEALEFFKNEMLETGLRNKREFDSTIKALKGLKEGRATMRYQSWDRSVRDMCARYKLKPEHFNDMFDLSTPENVKAAREKMEERLHEEAGKFQRAIDWASKYVTHTNIVGSSGQKARDAVDEAQALQGKQKKSFFSPTSYVLSDVDEKLGVVTRVMNLSLTDPEIAARINQATLQNTKPSFDRDAGPKNHGEMMENLNTKLSDAKVKEYFERDKKKLRNADGVVWDDMNQDQRRDAINDWEPAEAKQQKKGLGLWAIIFGALYSQVFKQRKEKLSTE